VGNMKEYLRIIKSAIFGKDMRGAIHDAINEMHNETSQNTTRQDLLEKKYDEQIKNITGSEVQSAEVVDARCGFDTLGSVIKQKVYHFENVEKMKNCLTLLPGDVCETLGYYEANDGGEARYVVRLKADEDVEDGGLIHYIATGLVAELIIEDYVTPEQFGAYGDNLHDDTIALQKVANTLKVVRCNNKYLVSNEIEIKNSFEMNKFSVIKASESFEGETVVSITKDTQRRNMNYYINVDSSNIAEYGISVGKARFCNLDLNVINSKNVGIDCNHYEIAGNGGNIFNCTVVGNLNGDAEIGIIIKNWDSTFETIVTQDVKIGVYLQEGELIANYVHSWLSDTCANNLWSESCVIKNIGYRRIFVEWLYQDSVKYGIFGGTYGKIKYFEYNLNLQNENNFNDEVNVYSPEIVTRLFIDIFTNIHNEDKLLKYVLNSGNANEFGVLVKNGVSTDINVIKKYQPFNDANNAPQVGEFYVTYDTLNLPVDQGGYLKCEIIESTYIQTYYSVNYKNNGNYYKRLRQNSTDEWSSWFKYAPTTE